MTEETGSGSSIIGFLLSIVSLGAGAYHGYCDSQGIPFKREDAEFLLTYGPAVLGGTFGVIGGGLAGGIGGGTAAVEMTKEKSGMLEKILKGTAGTVGGAVGGAVVFGIAGAGATGLQTLVGYGLGYAVGYVLK